MPATDHSLAELQAALGSAYTLEREIGRGGMATVYLAHDPQQNRRVALKVLHSGVAEPRGIDRFLREIDIARRLSHPNILPLLDSGRMGDVPFFVMPYVDGEGLGHRLKRDGSIPVAESVEIACQCLGALGFAHGINVLHRDIKPDNIMLDGAHAFLADFGIGKALGGDHASLTQTGIALGTPAYMSLEQAAGDPDLDARSDLYSLALVLYEMLSGATPFAGDTPQAMIAARFIQPVKPLADSVPGVTPALDAALIRALARQRDQRFASAADFANALRDSVRLTA